MSSSMTSDVMKLAPLAIGLVAFGAVVTVLIQREMAIGTWLFAAFLLGHGLVHVMFAAPPPSAAGTPGAEFAFDPARSWLVSGRILELGTLKALVVVLVAATVVGYALTAMATVNVIVPAALWSTLLLVSTAASAALMVVGLAPGLALGVGIDVILLAIVAASFWSPTASVVA